MVYAAVSSGVPLVFVNIQTEHPHGNTIPHHNPSEQESTEKSTILICLLNIFAYEKEKSKVHGRETRSRSKQRDKTVNAQIMHGVRLWCLPGVAEISIELIPRPGEVRVGMEIKRTEEVFPIKRIQFEKKGWIVVSSFHDHTGTLKCVKLCRGLCAYTQL